MEWLMSPEIWVAFLTLTALEIVLGIDNIIFISILVSRLPVEQQPKARFFGLALAMGTRILLLLSITWVMRLTADLFSIMDHGISGRDLILFFGGLFLLFKSTMEIFHSLEGAEQAQRIFLFLALRVGDDDDRAITQRLGDDGQTDAGIAGRTLDDYATRTKQAATFRVTDDEERGAILHRLAGIEELGLAQNGAAGRLGGAFQPYQRRVADRLDDRWVECHGPSPCL